ncbi:SCO family protein [Bosea vestrisii]|uniref:SCO family protein n=1 Tax=Bosea vestrisii TaxID=151416 RepID=UPI0024DFED0C|nr:SCO family protein [Bosea vestrisii]WID95665.1 SCO family protein [Bosea vestrisii]
MTRRISRRLLLAGLAAGSAVAARAQDHGGHSPSPAARPPQDPLATQFGGPFSLTDHTGKRVTEAEFLGRFMLIYFGFTRCTDTCPVDLPIIAQALDALGPLAAKVAPLFVSVDPVNDTPVVMAAYVANFHPRLIGLSGNEAELAAVARAYKVHRRKLTQAHHGNGEYTIDHGSLTYLMGQDGRFLTLLPHNSGAERMAGVLRKYIS